MERILYAVKAVCLVVIFSLTTQFAFSQDLRDRDIKKNISPISDPLKKLTSLNPTMFEYNTGQYRHLDLPGGGHYGFITEEFQQVFPGLVYKKPYSYMVGKNSYRNATVKTINLEGLIPVLIASIKEQQSEINALRAEVESLKRR
jgi:hypothetical protein